MRRPRALAGEAALRRLVEAARPGAGPVAPPADVVAAIADGRDVLLAEAAAAAAVRHEADGHRESGTARRRGPGIPAGPGVDRGGARKGGGEGG